MATYDVIIPAGGEIPEDFAREAGTRNKALIQFEGVTTIARIIDALRESGCVKRIAVVGPIEVQEAVRDKAELHVDPGSSGPDNILRGLKAHRDAGEASQKVIVVTSDLPFLTSNLVSAFLDLCPDADITLPLISREEYQARFPGATSTFIPLRDGTWTAGCMYLLDAKALENAKPYIDRIFEVRKSKIGMARLLGLTFLIKFLTKRLTVADVEGKIERVLHCKGKAIYGSPPELAYDIDDLEDYRFAQEHLSHRQPLP